MRNLNVAFTNATDRLVELLGFELPGIPLKGLEKLPRTLPPGEAPDPAEHA
jgi:predicted component of type VI protein secretion system